MGVLMGGSKHTIVSTNKLLASFMLYKSQPTQVVDAFISLETGGKE